MAVPWRDLGADDNRQRAGGWSVGSRARHCLTFRVLTNGLGGKGRGDSLEMIPFRADRLPL